MKTGHKTFGIRNKRGETMVEVLVAFTLLSIMLVVFAQGIAWASRSEVNASNSRNSADTGMKELQTDIANGNYGIRQPNAVIVNENAKIDRCVSTYEGHVYVVYLPSSPSGG